MNKWIGVCIGVWCLCASVGSLRAGTSFISYQDVTPTQEELQYDQETTRHTLLDKDQIKSYQKEEDFNYIEALPEDNAWTRFKQWVSDVWNSFLDWISGSEGSTSGFWGFVLNILPYVIVIGLFILVVWVFLKVDSGQMIFEKKRNAQVAMSDDEELIQRDDIQSLIDKALATGNYRLAIRFYYLLILQKMSGASLIDWQVQKTNHDYIFEIKDNQLRNQFRKITDIYDYIWYGNFDVDEAAFAKAQTTFLNLQKGL